MNSYTFTETIVILLGFISIWGVTLAIGVYPFLPKHRFQEWDGAMVVTALVGIIAGSAYTILFLIAKTQAQRQSFVSNVPCYVPLIFGGLLFVLLTTRLRFGIMNKSLQIGNDAILNSGKDSVRDHPKS